MAGPNFRYVCDWGGGGGALDVVAGPNFRYVCDLGEGGT